MSQHKREADRSFLGLSDVATRAERARAWVLPVPYEATTSYGSGTREGPSAILAASGQLELFDREFDCEPAMVYGIHTVGPLIPVQGSHEAMVDEIRDVVADMLGGDRAPELLAVLGGEHTISDGIVRGLASVIPADELVVVQVDAHADLRDEYGGSRFSHACTARRILETCPVFQIGIRSMSVDEEAFRRSRKELKTVFAEDAAGHDVSFLEDLRGFIRGKKVYMTIDLDGLDPAIMPSVGTPEPGGLSWDRTLDIVRVVCSESAGVPAFDVVELAPIRGLHAPDFLAAKLVYKILSHALLGGRLRECDSTKAGK
ncbi:MAG: agmatinase [Lentisphaerales bacterium]|jgi:agmatinase|nr:MAG: agmatinase [Lentisphaerales bacterium]